MGQIFSSFIENCNCSSANSLGEDITEIKREIKNIKENHLHTIDGNIVNMNIRMTAIETQLTMVNNNVLVLISRGN